jgi:hypothetical protein
VAVGVQQMAVVDDLARAVFAYANRQQPCACSRSSTASPHCRQLASKLTPSPLTLSSLLGNGQRRIARRHMERDMSTKCIAFSNNDVILAAWTLAQKLEDCVGCDIRRIPAESANIS